MVARINGAMHHKYEALQDSFRLEAVGRAAQKKRRQLLLNENGPTVGKVLNTSNNRDAYDVHQIYRYQYCIDSDTEYDGNI
mmetsp:Transcript_3726/g.5631  ORF Transcript_3726/g.5631 Transcript_3726/m.5631 type:complete len:81 (+) Transcript_3726:994-1236(+)